MTIKMEQCLSEVREPTQYLLFLWLAGAILLAKYIRMGTTKIA